LKKGFYHIGWALIPVCILGAALGGSSADSDVFLKPPGLRLISDPETVIPATYHIGVQPASHWMGGPERL